MSERERTVSNLEACFGSLQSLVQDLDQGEWSADSLCPGWSTFDVVAHLASVEHILTDWFPESGQDMPPFDRVGPFLAEVGEGGPAALAARLPELLEIRSAQLGSLDDEQFDAPSLTPAGAGTYGRFMQIREFDFWVHEQDIRVPLGRPGFVSGDPADMALDEIERSFGYIAGKRIGLPDGSAIRVRLTGPVERDICAVVHGRAEVVDRVDEPTVEVRTDSVTFCLLACGRIDPQEPIDDGRITWSGDDELGERAARNFAFTM